MVDAVTMPTHSIDLEGLEVSMAVTRRVMSITMALAAVLPTRDAPFPTRGLEGEW
jgi:hypothetical protein